MRLLSGTTIKGHPEVWVDLDGRASSAAAAGSTKEPHGSNEYFFQQKFGASHINPCALIRMNVYSYGLFT